MDAVEQTLFAELKSVMEEEGVTGVELTSDTRLKDLELSSMQFLRVVGALEDLIGVPLDAGLGDVVTVGDLENELRKLKAAQS